MISLLPWLSFDAVQDIAWTLIHFLWEGLLLAVSLRMIVPLCRDPAARHNLAVGTLLVMGAAPIATFLFLHRAVSVGILPAAIPSTFPLNAIGEAGLPVSAAVTSQWTVWVVIAWCGGIALFGVRALASWYLVGSLSRHGTLPPPTGLEARFALLVRRMGLKWPVRLLQSTIVNVPVVVGWFRPVILIPLAAIAGLPQQELDALILHELAHIRRLDAFTNILLIAVETILFYHPAVWWVSRRVRIEREHCCDDAAVAISGDPAAYVEALAALEVGRSAVGWVLASNGGGLKQRAARLLDTPSTPLGLPIGAMIGSVLLGLTVAGVAVAENKAQASAGRFEIHVVDDAIAQDAEQGPTDDERLPAHLLDPQIHSLWMKHAASIDGTMLAAVHLTSDGAGNPAVGFVLADEGRTRFAALTHANIGRRLAVIVDGTVIVAPTIKEEMDGGKGQISGNFTEAQARMLAAKIMGLSEPPAPKSDATSTLCRFTTGPRANQFEDHMGSTPRRVGLACQDGRGSAGVIIAN